LRLKPFRNWQAGWATLLNLNESTKLKKRNCMSQDPSVNPVQSSYLAANNEALSGDEQEDILSHPNLEDFNPPPVSGLPEYSDTLKALPGERSVEDWENTEEFPRE
jgi:hypothetical protein